MGASICNAMGWETTTNINRLQKIDVEPLGPRHNPVKHSDALQLFKERLGDSGAVITKENGMLSQDLLKYVYTCEVEDTKIPDFGFTLGFINFNNLCKAFTGLFGERVFVCSNEMFKGETINDNKRHTKNVMEKLTGKVDSIIEKFNEFRLSRLEQIQAMKDFKVDDAIVGEMIVQMLRKRIMSNTNVSRIVREWDYPSHEDFADKNLWSFQNAVTEVAKGIHDPNRRIDATHQVADLIEARLIAA